MNVLNNRSIFHLFAYVLQYFIVVINYDVKFFNIHNKRCLTMAKVNSLARSCYKLMVSN